MTLLFDKKFSHRISAELKEKINNDIDSSGFIARGILESIRLLEGEKVAPSTKAMKHKERELLGVLTGYYHIHVAEDNLTRMYNNIGKIKNAPVKSPDPEAIIDRATNEVLLRFVKRHGLSYLNTDIASLTEVIKESNFAKRNGLEKILAELNSEINKITERVFSSTNKITGDWLIYWKDNDGVNYYLEHSQHTDSTDEVSQKKIKAHLDFVLKKLTH